MTQAPSFFEIGTPVKRRLQSAPTALYLGLVVFCAFAGLVFAQAIGIAVGSIFFDVETLLEETARFDVLTVTLISAFLPIFFVVAGLLRLFERRGLGTVGMGLRGAVRNYARGVLVGLVMLGSVVLVMRLLGFAAVESPLNGQSLSGAFVVLIGWIVQGAAEEVLTRGWLLQIFGRITTPLTGIIVSSLFFTLLHGLNDHIRPIALLNLFLFGVFAALYTIYEGGLWGVFAIHSVWNWAQGNLFGFEVSGNEINDAIVLDLMEVGPDLWTGGQFGPEGGLLCTIVLGIAIAGASFLSRRSKSA